MICYLDFIVLLELEAQLLLVIASLCILTLFTLPNNNNDIHDSIVLFQDTCSAFICNKNKNAFSTSLSIFSAFLTRLEFQCQTLLVNRLS